MIPTVRISSCMTDMLFDFHQFDSSINIIGISNRAFCANEAEQRTEFIFFIAGYFNSDATYIRICKVLFKMLPLRKSVVTIASIFTN